MNMNSQSDLEDRTDKNQINSSHSKNKSAVFDENNNDLESKIIDTNEIDITQVSDPAIEAAANKVMNNAMPRN